MKWILAIALLCASCGYRWGLSSEGDLPTITVPYISGDDDGMFTTELSNSLSSSGLFDVRNSGGQYRLAVCIGQNKNDTIGYRRDPQRIKTKIKHQLLACEGRRQLEADVTLYEGNSDKIAAGPFRVTADVDYDYVDGDSYPQLTFISKTGETVVVLPFSLGQLESIEAAQEATNRPLYRKISQKIVDVISAEW